MILTMAWNVENMLVAPSDERNVHPNPKKNWERRSDKNMPVLFQILLTTVSVFHERYAAPRNVRSSMPSAYGDETKERSKSKRSHWVSVYAANLHLIHGTGIEAKYPENCQCKWKFERRIQAVSENSPGFRHGISICQFFCWSFCFHQFLHLLVTVRDTHAVNSCGLDSGGECLGARGFSQVGLASWPCRRYLIISLSIQKNGLTMLNCWTYR